MPCASFSHMFLYGHVIGGILHYCCWWEGPGKVCKEKPWKRLGLLFQEIQQEYTRLGCENRMTNLRVNMFTSAQQPWASKANLDCKAGEAKHLLPALVPVLERLFGTDVKEEQGHMLSAASSLEKLVALWDEAGMFLTAEELGKAQALGKEFLLSYKFLNAWSLEKNRNSFHIVAKHHSFIHLLANSKFMNPKRHWNFRGEEDVGQEHTSIIFLFQGCLWVQARDPDVMWLWQGDVGTKVSHDVPMDTYPSLQLFQACRSPGGLLHLAWPNWQSLGLLWPTESHWTNS